MTDVGPGPEAPQDPHQQYVVIARIPGAQIWSEIFTTPDAARQAADWIKAIQASIDVRVFPDPPIPGEPPA